MYKYKMLIFFVFIMLIFSNVSAYMVETPLLGKIIYLDAGHPEYL